MKFAEITSIDIDEVYELFHQYSLIGVHKPSYYTISSLVQLYGSICGSIRINDRLVAVSLNCPTIDNSSIYIYAFAVNSFDQGKGIGAALFTQMAMRLTSLNHKSISLRVINSNSVALRFWTVMGFTEVPGMSYCIGDEFAETYLERSL